MSTIFKRLTGRAPDVSAVLARFPVPVALMAIFTVLLILFKDSFYRDEYEAIASLCVGLVIAGYVSVCLSIGLKEQGKPRTLPLQLLLSLIICVLAWFSKDLRINLVMAVGAILLALGNSVRLRRDRDDLHIWDFTHKLWTGAGFAVAGSIIFTLGVFAISAALDLLFNISIRGLVEDLLLPIGLGFLAPLYWLATLPPADEPYTELTSDPGFVSKAVAFPGTWLLAPLTLIFALILLAYGLKILATMSLPEGEIGGLVTPFLIIGTLTWLVLTPPFIQKNAIARLFRKIWFLVSLPATVLLAVSVFVRVREYGLTPERIALILLVIWALVVPILFTFAKDARRDIRIIPGFAAVLLAGGALFAGVLSINNQAARAKSNLIQAGIMEADGSLANGGKFSVSDEVAAGRARGAIEYLQRHEADKAIERLFPYYTALEDGELIVHLELNGFDIMPDWRAYLHYRGQPRTVSISDFTTMSGPFSLHRNSIDSGGEAFSFSFQNVRVQYVADVITFFKNDVDLGYIDMNAWLEEQSSEEGEMKIENPVVMLSGNDNRAAILIQDMNLSYNKNGVMDYFNTDVYLLTRD